MEQRQKTVLVAGLIIVAILLLFSIFKTTSDPNAVSAVPATPEEQALASHDALRETVPADQIVPEGDIQGLKKMYKSKFGLEISEIRKNPDGTYDAVISGGNEVRLRHGPIYTPDEQKQYTREFMDTFNEGKKVEITETDQQEIAKFRKSVMGQ